MNVIYKILVFFNAQMNQPTMYGWFHILFLILMIAIIIFLCVKYKEEDNKKVKKILLICSIIMLSFEVYKQVNFSFNYDETKYWWDYQWYAFPFQFCSTPMYVALLAASTENKHLEKMSYAFLVTYGLVGGLVVMLYPSTVFISTIGISIQTMVHHGLMVIMGMYLLITKRVSYSLSTIKNGFMMFIWLVLIALLINISTYYLNIDNGLEMFFISPFHPSSLPIFNIIYENVPYLVFLLLYIVIFTIGCSIPIYIIKFINKKLK